MKILVYLLLILWFFGGAIRSNPISYSIDVKITNLRNLKGRIQMQIYKNQDTFASEKPWKTIQLSKKDIKNKILTYTFSGIPSGTYGIAMLDDENENSEMDFKMMLPNEGYGFSDFYHTSWSRPTFSDFNFVLNENKSVLIKVKY